MLGADFLCYPCVLAVPHTASGPKMDMTWLWICTYEDILVIDAKVPLKKVLIAKTVHVMLEILAKVFTKAKCSCAKVSQKFDIINNFCIIICKGLRPPAARHEKGAGEFRFGSDSVHPGAVHCTPDIYLSLHK